MAIPNSADLNSNKNAIGNNTDDFTLQKVFKAAYIILHTRGISNRLEYLFESKELF
jgi:hypothetical protein